MRSSRPSTRTPRSARASASPSWPPKAVRYTSHRSSPRGQGSPVTAALTGPDNRGQWPDGWPGHHIRPPAISGHPPHQATHHIRPLATSSGPATPQPPPPPPKSAPPPYHQPPPPHQPRHIIKPRHHIRPPAISSSPATISGHPPQATRKGWPYYIRCGCGSASRVGRAKARPVIRSLVKRANEVTG